MKKLFTDTRILTKKVAFFTIIILLVSALSNGVAATLNSYIKAGYTFDGNALDVTYNGFDFTNGSATLTTGIIGQAYSYDGTSEFYSRGSLGLDGAMSVCFWHKPNNFINEQDIVSDGQNTGYSWLIGYVAGSSNMRFLWNTASSSLWSTSTHTSTAGTWEFVCAVYDTTQLKIYFDGVNTDNFTTYGGAINTNTNTLDVGRRSSADGKYYNGVIDELYIWNRSLNSSEINTLYNNGSGLQYPFEQQIRTWTIRTIDLYDDQPLAGANVTFTTGCTNTTDNNGYATVTNATSGCEGLSGTLTSVTVSHDGYTSNQTSYTIGENQTTTAGLYQALIPQLTATKKITGETYTGSYTVTTSSGKSYADGTNIYAKTGLDNFTFTANNWYDKTATLNVSSDGTTNPNNISGVYNNKYTFTAKYYGDGAINNFTVTLTSNDYNETASTTNGTVTFNLLQGLSYNATITATGYSTSTTTVTPTEMTGAYEFNLYQKNTFNISVYDEQTNTPITGHNITIEFISDDYARTATYNGSPVIEELLLPGSYEIRYYEEGDNATYGTTRSYYTTLQNNSAINLKLYQIKNSESTFYTPVIMTSAGYYAEGATVKVIRGYIQNNSLVGRVVEMGRADPNGQVTLRIQPNDVYYKFIGERGDEKFETNYFKITQQTHTFQLSSGAILTSINLANKQPYTLEYLDDTDTFRLTWDDDSNVITNGCLNITRYDENGVNNEFSACSEGSTGSIVHTITDKNQTRYEARAYIETNTKYSTLTDYLDIDFKDSYKTWGMLGIFLTLIVFLFAINLANSAEGVAISGLLGLLLVAQIGIFHTTWTAVIGLAIVTGVIIYKSRT